MNDRLPDAELFQVQQRVHGAEHRLKDLTIDMHEIWRRSCDELLPGSPIDLYAVDSDVVYMFMVPTELHHYGALLRYDGAARQLEDTELQELETKLVEFLGNLIFFQLQSACPPILIGEHAQELQRILAKACDSVMARHHDWNEIANSLKQASADLNTTSREHLARAAGLVQHEDTANKVLTRDDINLLLSKIQDQLRGDGAIGKLFRFDLLASSERLKSLDSVAVHNADGSPSALPSPLAADGKYIAPVGRLAARLLQRMSQLDTIHSRKRKLTMHSDAIVLAHLAWLNEQLAADSYYLPMKEGAPRRIGKVLLISGSQLLPRAIKDLQLHELDQSVFSPLALLGHQLMDQYVQTISCEASPGDHPDHGSRASSLISFLDSMRETLAQAVREDNYEKIGEALKRVRAEHSRLVASWQGRQLFGEHSQPKGISDAISELAEAGTTLDGLADFVSRLSVRAWQAFARSVTLLGFKKASRFGAVQSNIPPLNFDDYPAAQDVMGRIHRYVYDVSLGKGTDIVMNKSTIVSLTEEDRSKYTEFLCYALWALAHGMVQNAQGCAELALSIVNQSLLPSKARMRADALYLSAHMLKLCAGSAHDMDRARQSVVQLMQDLAAEQIAPDPRMSAELFSIDAHVCYLDAYGPPGKHPPPHREEKITKLLNTYMVGRQLLDALNGADGGGGDYRREFIRQQLLVNLLQLALLCKFGMRLRDDGAIDVYIPIEEFPQVVACDASFTATTEELIAHLRYLDADLTGALPRPSVLATSVVAAAHCTWKKDSDSQEEVYMEIDQMDLIDPRRGKFLEAARRYRNGPRS